MNILMLTNLYTPRIGGVTRSVQTYSAELRRQGHQVKIVAPHFVGEPTFEPDVVRVPSIANIASTGFSLPLPVPSFLLQELADFQPQMVHSHHPFLLGDTALRIAAQWNAPIVSTYHTNFDAYRDYIPGHSTSLHRFVVDLALGYCRLCDTIIAPSQTIAQTLRAHGVTQPIVVLPTGVETARFATGDGQRFRARWHLPADVKVLGHVGRLSPEKNLIFLSEAVARALRQLPNSYFVVVGTGAMGPEIIRHLSHHDLEEQLRLTGPLEGQALVDAYSAMDVFVFASRSETQGMVITEAMAAGVPVVALDGPGVREVVRDNINGRLLHTESVDAFANALVAMATLSATQRQPFVQGARHTADEFSMTRCTERLIHLYEELLARKLSSANGWEDSLWATAYRRLHEEWLILNNVMDAVTGTLLGL